MQEALSRLRPVPKWAKQLAAALLLIVLIEVGLGNLPHWRSLAAGGTTRSDSASPSSLGPGLRQLADGSLLVSDPTQAYIEAPAKGTVAYLRVEPALTANGQLPKLSSDEGKHAVWNVHVRLDLQEEEDGPWVQAGSGLVNPRIAGSLYLKNRSQVKQAHRVRLWIGQERKAVVSLSSIQPNPLVPFSFNLARVAFMLALAALLIALAPRSRLWQIQLDSRSRAQRFTFWTCILAVTGGCLYVAFTQISGFTVRTYHDPGAYSYDFNQYGHLADAFLHGHPWLDLPVPDSLANSPNPYDVYARERLLAAGEEPIYWDHVFYQGRWYSYFGPLPAVLMFAPYRLLTSLFVPGGLMLPTPAACAILVAAFTLTCSLLIIRLIHRFFPHASLAAAILALLAFMLGSQVVYLWVRSDFYTVPFDASLFLTSLGLWMWLGARRVRNPSGKGSRLWTVSDLPQGPGGALANPQVYLSLPRLAGGAFAIAGSLGCRQTFILSGLLAFPIFADELKAMCLGWRQALRSRRQAAASPQTATGQQQSNLPLIQPRQSLSILLAALLPVGLMVGPLLAYNAWRFGSALNFGNTYQITVVNLNSYKPAAGNIAWLIGYYLFLPLTPSAAFPYLQRTPAPLPVWQYSQPGLGGFFTLAPVFALALLLAFLPAVRRKLKASHCLPFFFSSLALAALLLVFTSYIAGLDARYILDFSWLLAVAAILPLTAAVGAGTDSRPQESTPASSLYWLRWALLLALLLTALFTLATGLINMSKEPIFAQMQAWFTPL